jgi:hypothetical protein
MDGSYGRRARVRWRDLKVARAFLLCAPFGQVEESAMSKIVLGLVGAASLSMMAPAQAATTTISYSVASSAGSGGIVRLTSWELANG